MIDGTRQDERALAIQTGERFAVDGLKLEQLAALCRRLAQRLRFIDLNNASAGTWEALFDGDETLVLARIANFDAAVWQQHFAQLCDNAAPPAVVAQVLTLATRLDRWYAALLGHAVGAAVLVSEAIAQMVQGQLAEPLAQAMRSFASDSAADRSLQAVYAGLAAALWRAPLLAPADWQPRLTTTAADARPGELRGLGFSVLHVMRRTQMLAQQQWPLTLDSGQHEPAAGLLLVFLRLYARVQAQVNGFADRHIDFYYRRVLGLSEHGPQPDHVHVSCRPDPNRQQPVAVPAGTRFMAGKNAQGQPLLFRALEALSVDDAQVVELASLRLVRDGDVWPECSMGYVTSVKAQRLGLPGPDAAAVPLLGGGSGSRDAQLGLALASPLLLLNEGLRTIDLELRLGWPAPTAQMLAQHVEHAAHATHAAAFRQALGELFACWLLGDGSPLQPEQRNTLLRRACELHVALSADDVDAGSGTGAAAKASFELDPEPGVVLRMCEGLSLDGSEGGDSRELVFYKVIDELFDVSLSHAEGWLAVDRVQFSPARAGSGGGLQLRITLRHEDPAVVGCRPEVHGAQWPTRLPVLRLQVSPLAGIHPYSLFEHARFLGADLRVAAEDVRQLKLHNQLGPLDASKSFAPFGPLPSNASYLVLGAPEAAAKPLEHLRLKLRWSGLPDDAGGWATHYAAYGEEQRQGGFTAALSLLQNGQWYPCSGRSVEQPLFAPAQGDPERLQPAQDFDVDNLSVREHATGSDEPLVDSYTARDGLLRLQLNQPRGAFGHAQYPELLSQAVSSPRWRKGRQALPRAPYTPELESISLDYSAHSRIEANASRAGQGQDSSDRERLLHINPSGVSELNGDNHPLGQRLLPSLGPDGSLYIGLKARRLDQPLSLYFQLRPQNAGEVADDEVPEGVQWACLVHDRWVPLRDSDILADGTFGLLTSGVVKLTVPAAASADSRLLGQGRYWLRLSATANLDSASRLVSVHAQALPLERVIAAGSADAQAGATLQPVPAGTITAAETPLPGLASVLQMQASSGLHAPETAEQLRTRAGERLRHKNRGSLAWDMERLVLARHPEVFKVRCFSWRELRLQHESECRQGQNSPAPVPGTVLVVVVPAMSRNDPATATAAPRLDTLSLRRISQALGPLMPAAAQVQVHNPLYERVQARCRVRLARGAQPGVVRRELDRVITEYLSPWFDTGFGPRLDWTLGCDEVETVVRQVPGVAEVAGLSLLHVTRLRDRYRLGDTADPKREGGASLSRRVPWSLALPVSSHLIEFAPDLSAARAEITGVEQLRVGETFVVLPDDATAAAGP